MKAQEALHEISTMVYRNTDDYEMRISKDCYKSIVSALEKQIPKKPYMDNDNGVYEKERCPSCHRSIFPNDHHCICGQALDQSEHPTEKGGVQE